MQDAQRMLGAIFDDAPGLELEPGAITLGEIQRRAAAFDPLTLRVDPEVAAISAYAWASLGSRGVALHVKRGARVRAYLVLARGQGRGVRYQVEVDGKLVPQRFTRLEEAVEAVDYEVGKLGRKASASALPSAGWRDEPVPGALEDRLARRGVSARTHGEALARLAYAEHGPRRRFR